MKLLELKCSEIDADPESNVSRGRIDPADCAGLAETIQEHGLQIPVIVRKDGDRWKLVAGFRRYTAVSIILGLETIHAIVTESDRPAEINLLENLQRRDLSLWEEIVGLRDTFPDDTPMTYIQKAMGKGKTWVNVRWKAWNLPEEVKAQIEAELLCFADIVMLVQRGVEAEQASAKLIAAKAAGKNTNERRTEVLEHRRSIRGKKTIQQTMTKCLERGEMPVVQALRFAIGEIEEKTLINWLDERRNGTIVE